MPTIHGYQRELLAGLAVMLDLAASPTRRQVADGARRGERLVLARLSAGTVAPELFAALTDPFEAFRLEAALALIRSGERRGSKRALAFCDDRAPSVRALLAEETRSHLPELGASDLMPASRPRTIRWLPSSCRTVCRRVRG
jgi:hypothetical protein